MLLSTWLSNLLVVWLSASYHHDCPLWRWVWSFQLFPSASFLGTWLLVVPLECMIFHSLSDRFSLPSLTPCHLGCHLLPICLHMSRPWWLTILLGHLLVVSDLTPAVFLGRSFTVIGEVHITSTTLLLSNFTSPGSAFVGICTVVGEVHLVSNALVISDVTLDCYVGPLLVLSHLVPANFIERFRFLVSLWS